MPEEEILSLIDERIKTHDQDPLAHDLAALRQSVEIAESKTGIWSIRAADEFKGPDGPLTTTEVGNLSWSAIGGNQLYHISGVARTPDGQLRGTTVDAGMPDGQVEAVLTPGDSQAGLYLRFDSPGNYLMLGRGADGVITLLRFLNGPSTAIVPPTYRVPIAGERYKARLVGERIWIFRIVGSDEELLFDTIEPQFRTKGAHGIRVSGTGSIGNFRLLKREEI